MSLIGLEHWCWCRFLRVPWTAKRTDAWILKAVTCVPWVSSTLNHSKRGLPWEPEIIKLFDGNLYFHEHMCHTTRRHMNFFLLFFHLHEQIIIQFWTKIINIFDVFVIGMIFHKSDYKRNIKKLYVSLTIF